MKSLLFLLIISMSAPQALALAKVIGNGGDPIALDFKASAFAAIQTMRSQSGSYTVNLDRLQEITQKAQVLVVDQNISVPFDQFSQNSTAENIQAENLILVNRADWSKITDPQLKRALALHEVLSLMGIESTANYPVSQKYLISEGDNSSSNMQIHSSLASIKTPCKAPTGEAQGLFAIIENSQSTMNDLQSYMANHTVSVDALSSQCLPPLFDALSQTRDDFFWALYAAYGNPDPNVSAQDPKGMCLTNRESIYLFAIRYGDVETIQRLKKLGGDLNKWTNYKSCNSKGKSELAYAAWANSSDVVQALIRQGARVNDADQGGKTALMLSVANLAHPDVPPALIQAGANVNAKDKTQRTALLFALGSDANASVIDDLLRAGADVNAVNKDQEGAMMIAGARQVSPAILKSLLQAGADVKSADVYGVTPMMYALEGGANLAYAQIFIAAGARTDTIDKSGTSCLMAAASGTSDVQVLQLLIKAGNKLNQVDATKSTVLEYAAINPNVEITQFFLKNGANVNASDATGQTALMQASSGKSSVAVINALVQAHANVNATDNTKETALVYAVQKNGSPDIVRALLQAKATVNIADKDGITPLMRAVYDHPTDITISQILVQAGANLKAKSNAGHTAYDYAKFVNANGDILQLLNP